jgi:hypothetical protein
MMLKKACPHFLYYASMYMEKLDETTKISGMTSCVPALVQTQHLPHTNQNHYQYSQTAQHETCSDVKVAHMANIHLSSSLLWDVMQQTGSYRHFRTTYQSHLQQSSLTLEYWSDWLSQNTGNYQSVLHNIPEE